MYGTALHPIIFLYGNNKSMCYDLQASIRSTLTGIITCYILYNYNLSQSPNVHRTFQTLALFFAFVTLMQVYDWIFWESLKYNNGENTTNYIFTKIAMISNHLQPIVLASLVNQVYPLNETSKLVLLVYSIFSILYSVNAYQRLQYTTVTERSTPVLDWQWNSFEYTKPLYTLFVLSFILTSLNLPYPLNYLMVLINIATYSFSYYSYKNTAIGKGWCFISCYVPLFLLLVQMVFKF